MDESHEVCAVYVRIAVRPVVLGGYHSSAGFAARTCFGVCPEK